MRAVKESAEAEGICYRLRQYMGALGITQTDLCGLMGIPRSTLSRRLSGDDKLRLTDAIAICKALKIPPQLLYPSTKVIRFPIERGAGQ